MRRQRLRPRRRQSCRLARRQTCRPLAARWLAARCAARHAARHRSGAWVCAQTPMPQSVRWGAAALRFAAGHWVAAARSVPAAHGLAAAHGIGAVGRRSQWVPRSIARPRRSGSPWCPRSPCGGGSPCGRSSGSPQPTGRRSPARRRSAAVHGVATHGVGPHCLLRTTSLDKALCAAVRCGAFERPGRAFEARQELDETLSRLNSKQHSVSEASTDASEERAVCVCVCCEDPDQGDVCAVFTHAITASCAT